MGEVVQFPGAGDAAQRAEQIRRWIRATPMPDAPEIRAVAQNLHRLLAEAEKGSPGFKRHFCQKALGARPGDSTKRLREVALDPAKSPEEALKAPLRKKSAIYADLAEHVANMTGRDRDATLVELFAGCDIKSEMPAPPDPLTQDPRAEFWGMWEASTEAILRDFDVSRAFQIDCRFGNVHREWKPTVTVPLNFGDTIDLSETEASQFMKLPKVLLGEFAGPRLVAKAQAPTIDGGIGEFESWCRVWFRIWWGIAPVGPRGGMRGCFVVTLATQQSAYAFPVDQSSHEPARALDDDWRGAIDPQASWSVSGDQFLTVSRFSFWRRSWALNLGWTAQTDDILGKKIQMLADLDLKNICLLRHLFGSEPSDDAPFMPMRFLEPKLWWSDLLSAIDASDTEWVGPDPHKRLLKFPKEPKRKDFEAEDAFDAAYDGWWDARFDIERQEEALREAKFGNEPDRTFRVFPDQDSYRTLGSKLERSVLELPPHEKPNVELRRRVEAYVKDVEEHAEKALRDWRRALRGASNAHRER